MTEDDIEYRITVYKDHASIEGWLTSDVLKMLIKLCKKEGFTHLSCNEKGKFKLVRKND